MKPKEHRKKKEKVPSEKKLNGGKRPGAGRPPGSPNKATQATKDLCDEVGDFKEILKVWFREATRRKLTQVGYLCSVKFAEYSRGKPPQQLQITGDLSKEQNDALRNLADKVMEGMI